MSAVMKKPVAEAKASVYIPSKKFSYLTIANNFVSPERLNLLGEDGWELVTVTNTHHYFKRELI